MAETQYPSKQSALQANKAAFFFRLERELEKVNAFYLHKEAEVRSYSDTYKLTTLAQVATQSLAR